MLIFIATSACSKENQEIIIDDTSIKSEIEILLDKALLPMEVRGNTLVFSSEENYQKVIDFLASIGDDNFDAFEKYYGFSSLRHTLYYKEIEDNMDELFATLLNQNSEIIIGAEKFSFDFATETVSVSVIMNDNVSKGSKTVYNFEDDYFSIQDDNNSENSKTDYCKSLDLTWDFYTNFLGAPTMRCRVRYFNFAIYHTLSAQFEHTTGYTFDPYHEFGLYTEGHCFVTNRNQYNNRDISLSSPIISYNLNNGITYRPYQNSRRLTDYRLYVNFYLNDDPHFQGINNYCNI